MKGEILMMNFKQTKANTMNGIASKSTLITFVGALIGVAATAYLASKEIPKAKAEVKAVLEREDLTKAQKATESVKVVAKNTWKTAVVAIGTVLLVTGTSAITAANTATTVAGLTSAVNLAEQKLKDTNEAIEELPQKAKEEVKRSVGQKVVNRATNDMPCRETYADEKCPDKYIWISKFDGVRLKATYHMVDNLERLVKAEIVNRGYVTVASVYSILCSLGAEVIWRDGEEDYPEVDEMYGWNDVTDFELSHSVYQNENGWDVHTIDFSEPIRDF